MAITSQTIHTNFDKLCLSNAVVHRAVQYQKDGTLTEDEGLKLAIITQARLIEELRSQLTNAETDRRALMQAADRIAELEREVRELQGELNSLHAYSIRVDIPDSIAEKSAITILQQMIPAEVTVWLGKVYACYVRDSERSLRDERGG